jgi:hypothetical protein
MEYHPAFFLSSWSNHFQEYQPTSKNNDLSVGPEIPGMDWDLFDFCFGLGTSMDILKFGTTWLEYRHTALNIEQGNALPNAADKKRAYDRISIGAQANLHAIPALRFPPSIETFLRLGYFNLRDNSGIDAFDAQNFGLLTPLLPFSQASRYAADLGWGPDERIYGTTLGLGASFLNKMIALNASLGFLSKTLQNKTYSGSEFGIDCIYMLR